MAGMCPSVGLTKRALCGSGGQDASWGFWAQSCRAWAGHFATGSFLRAFSSEPQLPLDWLACSPSAWGVSALAALSWEGEQRAGVGGRRAEGSSAVPLFSELGQRERRPSHRQGHAAF